MTTNVAATLWSVVWTHRRPEPLPGTSENVSGTVHVLTADPTGRDLYAIAEAAVLKEKRGELGFTMTQVHRGCEVTGTAVVTVAAEVAN